MFKQRACTHLVNLKVPVHIKITRKYCYITKDTFLLLHHIKNMQL